MAEAKKSQEDLYPSERKSYAVSGKIGDGGTSVIYHAYCISADKDVAVKVVDITDTSLISVTQIIKECTLTASLQHPNLVSSLSAFSYGGECWIILPLMTASCSDILKKSYPKGFENERWVSRILNDVLNGLNYVHEHDFVHRDLKASAILLDKDGVAKISDFGHAGMVVRSNHGKTFAGTPAWMAPEVMDVEKQAVPLSDIWSFGITALELVSGKPPRSNLGLEDLIKQTIHEKPPDIKESAGRPTSTAFKTLVNSCLHKEPTDRKPASELLKLEIFKDLMSSADLAKALKLDAEENIYVEIEEDEAPAEKKDAGLDFKVVKGDDRTERKGDGALKNIVLEINENMKEYAVGEKIEVFDPDENEWVEAVVCILNDNNVAVSLSNNSLKTIPRANTRRKRE